MSHLKLTNRYVLRCRLASEGGLHVGTGVASVESDAPFLRQGGEPYIPGSSLRGVMRSMTERIMNTLAEGVCCTLFEEGVSTCSAGKKERREELEKLTAAELDAKKGTADLAFCPMCGLFGSTLQASRLKITDAFLLKPDLKELNRRDGVGIDRDTGTAREQIKYDFEVLERGCEFEFTLQVENAEAYDFGLLYIALKEMEQGFDVGGKRSRGLGRVRLTGYAVQFFDEAPERGHGLRAFLDRGMASTDKAKFEGWLKEGFTKLLEGRC